MRVFSTFTGIGGFEVGIQNAHGSANRGSKKNQATDRNKSKESKTASATQRSDCAGTSNVTDKRPLFVGYSEIDKHAIKVYERNFPHVKNYGDITKINTDELPDFDCLVGGFPCQAFSIAGKRKGFEDTRGTLFFELARILRAKQPRLFVFENVKGLLSHDSGRTIKTIISTIDELGYDCQWQVLNSKHFNVAQNRERIYIVGHFRGTARPEVFPITGTSGANLVQINNPIHSSRRVFDSSGAGPAIRTMSGGGHEPKIYVPEATKKGYAEATVGQAINLSNPNSKTRRGRVSDVSPTLETSNQIHTLTKDSTIRKLTPLECERLQGFMDNWTKYGVEYFTDSRGMLQRRFIEMSDSQRYKMAGNAVTTNVVQAVFEKILKNY